MIKEDQAKTNDKRIIFPWFVIIFAIISPLIVFANNLGEAELKALWRPLFLSLTVVGLVFTVFYLIFRERDKAAFLTFLVEIFIFIYGHIYNILKPILVFGFQVGRHRFLFPLLFVLFLILFWRAVRFKGDYHSHKIILNTVGLFLLIFQLVRIGSYEIQSGIADSKAKNDSSNAEPLTKDSELRDVYLIVLDAYTRSDWLEEWSGYDNSDFLESLEEMGFYVVRCSRSNYSYTLQSMTSELNLDYLENLEIPYSDPKMTALLRNNKVRKFLSNQGYEFITFQTGYPWIEMKDADRFIKPNDLNNTTEFGLLLLDTTILKFFKDMNFLARGGDQSLKLHAQRVQSTLDYLQKPITHEKPIFVYAHIVSPHSPWIFNTNGSINFQWKSDKDSTRSTYIYIENQILKAIEVILESSKQEPIIILQSDHGDGDFGYANLNLNAMYLPNGGDNNLYPTMTSVNIFRIVFNTYFNGNYSILQDVSFFSERNSRYDFKQIDDPFELCQ